MLINVKKKKNVFYRTDGQTHGQLKTIVRNLTISRISMLTELRQLLGN